MFLEQYLALSSDSDDEKNEEAERLQRERLLKQRTADINNTRKRKKEEKEAEEALWFGKDIKIERLTLKEYLERKIVSIELKDEYQSFIPRVVEHFGGSEDNFSNQMKAIETESQLMHFVTSRHMDIVSNSSDPNKDALHDWLVLFNKETISALREMTNIPSDVKLKCFTVGNAFTDAKSAVIKLKSDEFKSDEFSERMRLQKIKEEVEEEETEKVVKEVILNDLPIKQESENIGNDVDILAEELKMLGVDCLRNRPRDTSPPPISLSAEAEKILLHSVSQLFLNFSVDDTVENSNVNLEEDDDFSDIFSSEFLGTQIKMEVDDDTEVHDKHVYKNDNRSRENNDFISVKEELESSDDDELEMNPGISSCSSRMMLALKSMRGTNFGKPASRKNVEEWKLQQFEDKRKKKRIVRFADYESPKNQMRIFIKPNGHFFFDGDNGPTTDYMDMSLKSGWDALREVEPPYVIVQNQKKCKSTQQRVTVPPEDWMKYGYHGNILGRFWYSRMNDSDFSMEPNAIEYEDSRCKLGMLVQYTQKELEMLYLHSLYYLLPKMRRGLLRTNMPVSSGEYGSGNQAAVHGVLLLTDWRLVHSHQLNVLINASTVYLPTCLGSIFFTTMSEFLSELLLDVNSELHTIIFAFGGTPQFKKGDFLRFWKQLIIHTTRSIDVFWIAQDWCDGLESSQDDLNHLKEFNDYVENIFRIMNNNGHKNYKWCDIRREYSIPPCQQLAGPADSVDTIVLEKLYCAYFEHFVNKCNCYADSLFSLKQQRNHDDFIDNDSRKPYFR